MSRINEKWRKKQNSKTNPYEHQKLKITHHLSTTHLRSLSCPKVLPSNFLLILENETQLVRFSRFLENQQSLRNGKLTSVRIEKHQLVINNTRKSNLFFKLKK